MRNIKDTQKWSINDEHKVKLKKPLLTNGRQRTDEGVILVTQILSLVLKQLQYLRSDLEHHQEQGNLLPSLSSYSEYVKHYRVKPNKLGINVPL